MSTRLKDSSYQTDLNRTLATELARSNHRIGGVAEILKKQAAQIQKLKAAIEIGGEKYFPLTDRGRKIGEMVTHVKNGRDFNPFDYLELTKEDAALLCYRMYEVGRTHFARIWMMHPRWGEFAFRGHFSRQVTTDLKLQALARFVQDRISDFEKL